MDKLHTASKGQELITAMQFGAAIKAEVWTQLEVTIIRYQRISFCFFVVPHGIEVEHLHLLVHINVVVIAVATELVGVDDVNGAVVQFMILVVATSHNTGFVKVLDDGMLPNSHIAVIRYDGGISGVDITHAMGVDDIGLEVEFSSGGGKLEGMGLRIGSRQLVAVTLHVNQIPGGSAVDIDIFVGIFPFEGQHIFVNRVPVKL